MKNKILYYPYINVPNSSWFTKALLYWDKVGSIIPYEYTQNPNNLDQFTRELLREELIEQVIPGAHIWDIPNFTTAFLEFLLSNDFINERRKAFQSGEKFRLHIEKMDGIEKNLEELKLAREVDYPWYDVEAKTAREFMAYLAASLGKHKNLGFAPTTDDISYLELFKKSSAPSKKESNEVKKLRVEILNEILPVPTGPLDLFEIRNFKEKHSHKLKTFRNNIEKELILLSDINDPELKKKRVKLFKEEADHHINEITRKMRKTGLKNISIGDLGSVIASTLSTSIGATYGLARAVYNSYNEDFTKTNPNFLYAAFAQEKFIK